MWQVSGRSDITDFEEVVRLDRVEKHFVRRRKLSLLQVIIYLLDKFYPEKDLMITDID